MKAILVALSVLVLGLVSTGCLEKKSQNATDAVNTTKEAAGDMMDKADGAMDKAGEAAEGTMDKAKEAMGQ